MKMVIIGLWCSLATHAMAQLTVSATGRYLEKEGKPFFYVGDTAWELFNRLNRQEVIQYLDNRKANQFNVIQCVALAEFGGLYHPNAQGDPPFLNNDPLQPNVTSGSNPLDSVQYDYWDHVDFVLDAVADRGMVVGLLPCWGTYVYKHKVINPSNAEAYGTFFGKRYANQSNIIWLLGGDERGKGAFKPVWDALAKGIVKGITGNEDYSRALMSFHPDAYFFSSLYYHDSAWLDFNMIQSAHFEDRASWRFLQIDASKVPRKPFLDAESLYEDHPMQGTNRYSTDYNIRKSNYWNLFAGAMGIVYGHDGIWQFYAPGRTPIAAARTYWYDALNYPGALQLPYLLQLVGARPAFFDRIPDQSLLVSEGNKGDHCQATIAADQSYLMVYFPQSTLTQSVAVSRLSGSRVQAWWFNPQTGRCYTPEGDESERPFRTFAKADQSFTPPTTTGLIDWVLILDDANKNYLKP